MKKKAQGGDRIEALRGARTQGEFAEMLHVTQPMISAWEGRRGEPSTEAYVRLGNLAEEAGKYRDALWFWARAGLGQSAMLSVAGKLLKERGAPPTKGEEKAIVRVPPRQQTGEATGRYLPLPVEFVPNPGSTTYLRFDVQSAGQGFVPGDIVVLDESYKDPKDLSPLLSQVALVEFPPGDIWAGGLLMGRLRLGEPGRSGPFVWFVSLWPFAEEKTPAPFTEQMVIGHWDSGLRFGAPAGAIKKAKAEAPVRIELYKGRRVLGRVVCWFRPPRAGKS